MTDDAKPMDRHQRWRLANPEKARAQQERKRLRAKGLLPPYQRQPPVPIAPPLQRLLRRWSRQDGGRGPVVSFAGVPVLSVKTALGRAVRLAGLDTSVTAYTLRHTTGSWLVQAGVSSRKVAELLGTSEALIERTYGHLEPDHLRAEVGMIGRARHQKVAEAVVGRNGNARKQA